MTDVKRVELSMPVVVRKHVIDKADLQTLLRSHKKASNLSNKQLASLLDRPVTEVEHWFRTDACWSVPDADIWESLKLALSVETVVYDAQVTEFIEQPGVFEKANRFYFTDGIAPALTVASADEKIIYIDDFNTEGERKMTQTNEVVYNFKPFNYVSLFSGIGGFESALNRLGGNCVLPSEIDKFANQSYEALYGEPTAGDITAITAENVPDHDVLVGGFPCQAFSVAGKRLGFDDTRGTLFFEVARLAKTKQPRAILLENVKGLVGHDGGKTLEVIVSTLNDIGYHVDFNVLNSKYFGVPQNRERIFIVALRDDLANSSPWIIEGTNVVAKGKRRISGYADTKTFNFDWPEQTEVTTRLRDVLESTVDEKYYLSEEKTAKLVAQLEDTQLSEEVKIIQQNQQRKQFVKGEVGTLHASMTNNQAPKVLEPQMLGYIDLKGHDAIKRVYSAEGVSPTLTTMGGGHREPKIAEHTTRYRIRKLTPLECWRLQGFTDEQHQTAVTAGLSDSQRYKQAGNAVTVNVIQAIGERLLTYI